MHQRKILSDVLRRQIERYKTKESTRGLVQSETNQLKRIFFEYIGPEEIIHKQIEDRRWVLSKMGYKDSEIIPEKLYLENLRKYEFLPKRMSEEELLSLKKDSLPSHYLMLKHIYGYN